MPPFGRNQASLSGELTKERLCLIAQLLIEMHLNVIFKIVALFLILGIDPDPIP